AGAIGGESAIWRLPVPLLVALRYARSTRRDASVRFLSSVTVWGVALGVAALVLAVSALSGFQATLLDDVLARSPRLQVQVPADADAQAWLATVRGVEGVDAAQVLLYGSGWLAKEGRVVACELIGYGEAPPRWFPGVEEAAGDGLVLPEALALRMGLRPGGAVRVVSPRPTLTPFSRQLPRSRKVGVAAIYDAGRSEDHDGRVALPLAEAESLLWPSDRRIDVEVAVGRVDAVAARLQRELPAAAAVVGYRELNRALFFALRLEKVLMFVGVFLIVAVASQSLVSSLGLIVASKRREIGVLASLGLGPRELGRAVVLLGMVLTAVGVVVGGTVGAVSAWLLDRFELLRLPADVYIVDFVPFLLRPLQDLSLILLGTAALAWWAARSAGRRVAALRPAEALRR
ncbi:MAG: FtsX-like permease family protein, partial [Thermoanaerobaculia bacterium]|nr:FtsX-like permease family protein [Thermoanaerobaculia bacterium]